MTMENHIGDGSVAKHDKNRQAQTDDIIKTSSIKKFSAIVLWYQFSLFLRVLVGAKWTVTKIKEKRCKLLNRSFFQ